MKHILYLLTIILLASCGNPQELQFQDVKGIRIKELSSNTKAEVDIQFYNPNKFGMKMKDGDIDLYLNNKLIGNAKLDDTYDVPGQDTFILTANMDIDVKSALPSALDILLNNKMTVELKGSVKAGKGVMIPIPIKYKGEQKLNVTNF